VSSELGPRHSLALKRRWARSLSAWRLVLALILGPTCGCSLAPDLTYASNRGLLDSAAEWAGLSVDAEWFEVLRLEVEPDSVLLQYRGVKFPSDRAWVLQFSPKSTEQDPESLADVFALGSVVEEGKRDFRLDGDGQVEVGPSRLYYVRYSFESELRGEDATLLRRRGILAVLRMVRRGSPVVYQFKLDNAGERASVGHEDLKPFLDAVLRS
jgi:hypothetical protein